MKFFKLRLMKEMLNECLNTASDIYIISNWIVVVNFTVRNSVTPKIVKKSKKKCKRSVVLISLVM